MTMEEFATKLKALLREAEESGLDVDTLCGVAEHIIENGTWNDEG